MKKSIPVRILTALGGLVLLAVSAAVVAEGFLGVPVMATLGAWLASKAALAVLGKIVGALVLVVLAVAAVICALPGKAPRQTGSIMQKGVDGPIGITVAAIRKMVLACAEKHPEITHAEVDVREARDGIIILMDVEQVGGVSIPLSMARLQKQVRQYVNGRTGLDVAEVRVMVDNQNDAHVASEFEVEDLVVPAAPVRVVEYANPAVAPAEPVAEQLRQMAEATAQPVQEAISISDDEDVPEVSVIPEDSGELDKLLPEVQPGIPEMVDEEEKPLHQRVFGAEEMPLTVPMPPEMTVEAAPEAPVEQSAEMETPAQPVQEEATTVMPAVQADEDWTAPSMQEAAEAVLTGAAEADEAAEAVEAAAPVDDAADAEENPEEETPVMMQ